MKFYESPSSSIFSLGYNFCNIFYNMSCHSTGSNICWYHGKGEKIRKQ